MKLTITITLIQIRWNRCACMCSLFKKDFIEYKEYIENQILRLDMVAEAAGQHHTWSLLDMLW